MAKFLGSPVTIPAATAAAHAVQRGYVDAADAALAARVATLESGVSGTGYQHVQSTPATVWQINHGLGFDPAGLTVISSDGYAIDGATVQYLTAGQSLRVSFDISLAGTAYLS